MKVKNEPQHKNSAGELIESTKSSVKPEAKKRKKRHKERKDKKNNKITNSDGLLVAPSSTRDFTSDLIDYLDLWTTRSDGRWKFNKVLQAWALEHCLDVSKIDDETFEQLYPYIMSVVGGARDRVKEKCLSAFTGKAEAQEEKSVEFSEQDVLLKSKCIDRAKRISGALKK